MGNSGTDCRNIKYHQLQYTLLTNNQDVLSTSGNIYPKIYIGPQEIAGYYAYLVKGFQEIGIKCDYVVYYHHPFGYYNENTAPILIRWTQFFNRFCSKDTLPFLFKILFTLLGLVFSSIWAIYAIFHYDIFIFGFGHSLMPYNFDLRILRLLKKTVISNLAHGSEARPPYIDGARQSPDGLHQSSSIRLLKLAKSIKSKNKTIEKYSTVIIGAPFSTSHFTQKKVINWFSIGVPCAYTDKQPPKENDSTLADKKKVRVLHSPSHKALKGTQLIQQAIQHLQDRGYEIELILLQGKLNSEVLQEIQLCDFVVDQLYSDTPMAGFATEAAWFGKPAVVGGYGFDYLATLIPKDMWPPSKLCHPDKIEQAIEDLIVNPEERLHLGAAAQKFVREQWNAAEVARRYLRLLKGDIPEEWWFNPNTVTYLEGCGLPIARSKENIRHLIEKFGVASLQLQHRPDLEQAFLEFAEIKTPSPHA